jgi:hypothetical protein
VSSLGAPPRPHVAVVWELFDKTGFEVVLFDSRSGRVIRLNPSASAVWCLCDGVTTRQQIVEEIIDTFGLSRDAADRAVVDALSDFADAGLLVRDADSIEADASPLLPRAPDPCGLSTAAFGWVATVELDVGGWRVGVRAGSRKIADAIVNRFQKFVVASGDRARTNFSIRRVGAVGRYEVLNAGVRVALTRGLAGALRVLDNLLGGVIVYGAAPPTLVALEIGLVVRKGLAVLIDVDGLKCTDKRWALDLLDGATPTWRVLVDPQSFEVHVPPAANRTQSGEWQVHPLVGVVLTRRGDGRSELQRLYRLAETERLPWLNAIARLEGRVATYDDVSDAKPVVESLITRGRLEP